MHKQVKFYEGATQVTQVSPDAYDIGQVTGTAKISKVITIKNEGTAPTLVSDATLSSSSFYLSSNGCTGKQLLTTSPNNQCTVTVNFSGSAKVAGQSYSSNLSFAATTVAVSASVATPPPPPPAMVLFKDGATTLSAPLFLGTYTTDATLAKTITIQNSGGSATSTLSVELTSNNGGWFTLSNGCNNIILQAGASCSFSLRVATGGKPTADYSVILKMSSTTQEVYFSRIAPLTCASGQHIDNETCVANTRSCDPLPNNSLSGVQNWNGSGWGNCQIAQCANNFDLVSNQCLAACQVGQHRENTVCFANIKNCSPMPQNAQSGSQTWGGSSWGSCQIAQCSSGYTLDNNSCVAENVTYQTVYNSYGACSSSLACAGQGTETRTYSCAKFINGNPAGNAALSNCTATEPLSRSCMSPPGTKTVAISNGSKATTCESGQTTGSVVVSCDNDFHAVGETCVADVITYQAMYSSYGSCSAAAACDGPGTKSRTITQCNKFRNGQEDGVSDTSSCSDSAPTTSCDSPSGDKVSPISNGLETLTCAAGQTTGARVITCDLGYHESSGSCVENINQLTARIANGSGGSVADGNSFVCSAENGVCLNNYPYSSTVVLIAVPEAGFSFVGWAGDCIGTGTCSVSMSASKDVTATFAPIMHTVAVTADNGSVAGAGIYNYNTQVSLTATPNSNYIFEKWVGGPCDQQVSSTCVFNLTEDLSFAASFILNNQNNGPDILVTKSVATGKVYLNYQEVCSGQLSCTVSPPAGFVTFYADRSGDSLFVIWDQCPQPSFVPQDNYCTFYHNSTNQVTVRLTPSLLAPPYSRVETPQFAGVVNYWNNAPEKFVYLNKPVRISSSFGYSDISVASGSADISACTATVLANVGYCNIIPTQVGPLEILLSNGGISKTVKLSVRPEDDFGIGGVFHYGEYYYNTYQINSYSSPRVKDFDFNSNGDLIVSSGDQGNSLSSILFDRNGKLKIWSNNNQYFLAQEYFSYQATAPEGYYISALSALDPRVMIGDDIFSVHVHGFYQDPKTYTGLVKINALNGERDFNYGNTGPVDRKISIHTGTDSSTGSYPVMISKTNDDNLLLVQKNGNFNNGASIKPNEFTISKLTAATGEVDSSFGSGVSVDNDKISLTSIEGQLQLILKHPLHTYSGGTITPFVWLKNVIIDSSGAIYLFFHGTNYLELEGSTWTAGKMSIVKLSATGQLDTSFGGDGSGVFREEGNISQRPLDTDGNQYFTQNAIVDTDGSIYIMGLYVNEDEFSSSNYYIIYGGRQRIMKLTALGVVDSSFGVHASPNLVTNGSFDSSSSGWGGTSSYSWRSDGSMQSAVENGYTELQQEVSGLSAGKTYKIKADFTRGANNRPLGIRVYPAGSGSPILSQEFSLGASSGTVEMTWVADRSDIRLSLWYDRNAPSNIIWDNVSIKEGGSVYIEPATGYQDESLTMLVKTGSGVAFWTRQNIGGSGTNIKHKLKKLSATGEVVSGYGTEVVSIQPNYSSVSGFSSSNLEVSGSTKVYGSAAYSLMSYSAAIIKYDITTGQLLSGGAGSIHKDCSSGQIEGVFNDSTGECECVAGQDNVAVGYTGRCESQVRNNCFYYDSAYPNNGDLFGSYNRFQDSCDCPSSGMSANAKFNYDTNSCDFATYQQACSDSGGNWNNMGGSNSYCSCDSAYFENYMMTMDATCVPKTDYVSCVEGGGMYNPYGGMGSNCDCGMGRYFDGSQCVENPAYNGCMSSGGMWQQYGPSDMGMCSCSSPYMWDSIQNLCVVDNYSACSNAGGWWDNMNMTCNCSGGNSWNPNTYSCDYDQDGSNCVASNGAWEGGACTCQYIQNAQLNTSSGMCECSPGYTGNTFSGCQPDMGGGGSTCGNFMCDPEDSTNGCMEECI